MESTNMTQKADLWLWYYNHQGKIKKIKLKKFLNCFNKRINMNNGLQEVFATEKEALKNVRI